MGQSMPLGWLALVEHELLLFSAVFFLIGALDEFAVDLVWIWLRLTGRARCERIDRRAARERALTGPAAVLIPAWREEQSSCGTSVSSASLARCSVKAAFFDAVETL